MGNMRLESDDFKGLSELPSALPLDGSSNFSNKISEFALRCGLLQAPDFRPA